MPIDTENILVVHLVWAPLGPEELARFSASYSRHAAGVEHRLLVIFNGFGADQDLSPWRRAIGDVSYEEFRTAAPVLDLAAYRDAVEHVPAARYCFLNSYSVILVDDWLALLATAESGPRIGAVAASGSWGSRASHVRYHNRLGGPYARVFPDQAVTSRVFAELTAGNAQPAPSAAAPAGPPSLAARVAGPVRAVAHVAREAVQFAQFPSPHLRTNALLIERERWLAVCPRSPCDKLAAYRLESGRRGITARLRAKGLEVAIAGRDGRSYWSDEWPTSFTCWQGNQENLLIGDNQTRAYQEGDPLTRQILSGYAWGEQATPAV